MQSTGNVKYNVIHFTIQAVCLKSKNQADINHFCMFFQQNCHLTFFALTPAAEQEWAVEIKRCERACKGLARAAATAFFVEKAEQRREREMLF